MKAIVFRADASKTIGGGHVYRCLALSQELLSRGWECELLTRPESIPMLPSQLLDGVRVVELRTDELTHLSDRTGIPDIVVFDHYRIGPDVQSAWRNAGCLAAVIDDGIDRPHDADLLVNPDIVASEEAYRRFVGRACRLCLGPDYAFVRQEFVNCRPQSLRRRRVMDGAVDAFVSFGLTDPAAGCVFALSALEAIEFDGHADFVTGASALGLEELRRRIDVSPVACSLHVDPNSVAALMQTADLAIAAGGSSSWERCTLGLPSVVMSVAPNQRSNCEALDRFGAAVDAGDVAKDCQSTLQGTLNALLIDRDRLQWMSGRAAELCDGRGVERFASVLDEHVTEKKRGSVTL